MPGHLDPVTVGLEVDPLVGETGTPVKSLSVILDLEPRLLRGDPVRYRNPAPFHLRFATLLPDQRDDIPDALQIRVLLLVGYPAVPVLDRVHDHLEERHVEAVAHLDIDVVRIEEEVRNQRRVGSGVVGVVIHLETAPDRPEKVELHVPLKENLPVLVQDEEDPEERLDKLAATDHRHHVRLPRQGIDNRRVPS